MCGGCVCVCFRDLDEENLNLQIGFVSTGLPVPRETQLHLAQNSHVQGTRETRVY